jgi:outer membrane receptor protein involved in Fe transport
VASNARSGLQAHCRNKDSSALAVSFLTGSILLALGTAANAQQDVGPVEEVTVTGSRIQRTSGFTTAVPVTAVTAEDLTSFQPGRTMADQLDQLPQFYNTQSAQRGGGALFGGAGRSALDMRSMGPARTLVLLDGARVAPADRDGSVHIDNFPTALLSQIEVVTGGASAAYGADALAGVTNFRLNRNYTGLDFNLGAGRTDAGFGETTDFSVAYGTELGDRWHFIGSIENQQIDPIDPEPHELGDWSRREGIVGNPAWTPGNTSVPQNLILSDVHSTVHTPTGRISTAANAAGATVPFSLGGYNFTYDGEGITPFRAGDLVARAASTGNQSGGPEAGIADQAFSGAVYGAEVKRRNIFTGLTFDANDSTQFFLNFFSGETESNDYNQRGIPHLTSPWNGRIYVTNPFLPQNVRDAMIAQGVDSFVFQKQGTVFGQDGNWNDDETRHNQFDSWTLQLGIDKDLGDNWNMQARIQRGATDRFTTVYNEVRVDREYLAMDAVEVYPGTTTLVAEADRGTGVIICNVQRFNPTEAELQASVAGYLVPSVQGDDSLGGPSDLVPIPGPVGNDNSIRDCVPMNVLGQGNVSSEAAAYVVSPKAGDGAVTQEFAEILFTGDIYQGYGPGPFSMAVGATYREQWFWQRGYPQDLMAFGPPRNAPQIGIRGFPGGFETGSANLHEFSTVPVISGGYDVWELFAELNLPLWESESGAQRFELDVAGRHSDYSTSGGIASHKTGINFQASEAWRLRATVSRDVREPTFAERFNLQGGGGSVNDPMFNNQNFEITVTTGGNPDLAPEEADTVTAGFVYQPVNTGLQLSIDWYEIDLAGAVGTLGQQRIVTDCAAGVTALCGLISRDPSTGVIGNVRNVFLNIDAAKVRGIDYELLFNAEPDWFSGQSESLTFRLLAGRLLEDSTTLLSGAVPVTTDLAGRYTEPDTKILATVRYQIGSFGINLQQRYIPESTLDGANPGGPAWVQWEPGVVVGPGQITVDDNTVQSKSYTDLALFYDTDLDNGRNMQASLSISNLFDVDPPVIAVFSQRFSSQTFGAGPNNYDVYGRRYMLNFRYSF